MTAWGHQKPAFLGNTSYHGRVRGAPVGRRLGPSQQAIGPPWPGHFLTACLVPTNYHTGTYGTDRSHRATGSGSQPSELGEDSVKRPTPPSETLRTVPWHTC